MTDAGQEEPCHPAALSNENLLANCDVQRTKRGGPGGQHRNKTETAIVITHRETGVSGQASERRSQQANREEALFRLKLNLAIAVRREKSTEDENVAVKELWIGRVSSGKIVVSPTHKDFPALIAETLDWVYAFEFRLGDAARRLGVSTSQLVKFLKLCPEAWQWVQQQRHDRGLPRLK